MTDGGLLFIRSVLLFAGLGLIAYSTFNRAKMIEKKFKELLPHDTKVARLRFTREIMTIEKPCPPNGAEFLSYRKKYVHQSIKTMVAGIGLLLAASLVEKMY
ncbi:MAG TPA: hypothetical protein EYP39_08890 [Ghiorsea sp.]|nr:hypothetical protein [Ghiorsea sp.]